MRFRETLWFKKGHVQHVELDKDEIDVQLDDALSPSTDDLRPVEDRYLDDGSVGSGDSARYGLHTGATQGLPKLAREAETIAVDDSMIVDEYVLASELKGARARLAAMAAAGVALACAVVALV